MKIAIMGATGQVGSKIVERLMNSDHQLVLLTRNPDACPKAVAKGAKLIAGDVSDPEFLVSALETVDVLYVLLPPDNGSTDVFAHYQKVVDACVEAIQVNKIPRTVLQSSYGAQHATGTGPIVGLYAAEQRISAAAENFYTLRNGYFMENFTWMIEPMKAASIIPLPVKAESKTSFVSTDDIADVAAEVLQDEQWSGHCVREVLGPNDLSFAEVARIISNVTKQEISHLEMENSLALEALTKPEVGFSQSYAQLFVELHRAIDEEHLCGEHRSTPQSSTPTQFFDFADKVIKPLLVAA